MMRLTKESDIGIPFTITKVNIDRDPIQFQLIGERDPYYSDINKSVTFSAMVDKGCVSDLISTTHVNKVSGLMGSRIYIFKNCLLKSYHYIPGEDFITVEMSAADVEILEDINIQFLDTKMNVKAPQYVSVYEQYGNPTLMTYAEFCKKCLAINI